MASAENGNVMLLYVNVSSTPTAFISETALTIDYGVDMINTTAKADGGQRKLMTGERTVTLSVDALYVHSTGAQLELLDAVDAGTQVTVVLYHGTTPARYSSGVGYVSSLSIVHNKDEAATISATIELDGALA